MQPDERSGIGHCLRRRRRRRRSGVDNRRRTRVRGQERSTQAPRHRASDRRSYSPEIEDCSRPSGGGTSLHGTTQRITDTGPIARRLLDRLLRGPAAVDRALRGLFVFLASRSQSTAARGLPAGMTAATPPSGSVCQEGDPGAVHARRAGPGAAPERPPTRDQGDGGSSAVSSM